MTNSSGFVTKARFAALSLILAECLAGGCTKEGRKSFTDPFPLRIEICKHFNVNVVNLNIQNGSFLGISLINSPSNLLSPDEIKAQAREIAQFAKDHYSSIDRIKMIGVSFTIHKRYFLNFNYNNSLDSYFFDKDTMELKGDFGEAMKEGFGNKKNK